MLILWATLWIRTSVLKHNPKGRLRSSY
jgi:hypothetical protein